MFLLTLCINEFSINKKFYRSGDIHFRRLTRLWSLRVFWKRHRINRWFLVPLRIVEYLGATENGVCPFVHLLNLKMCKSQTDHARHFPALDSEWAGNRPGMADKLPCKSCQTKSLLLNWLVFMFLPLNCQVQHLFLDSLLLTHSLIFENEALKKHMCSKSQKYTILFMDVLAPPSCQITPPRSKEIWINLPLVRVKMLQSRANCSSARLKLKRF